MVDQPEIRPLTVPPFQEMPSESHNNLYDRERWIRALEEIAAALGSEGEPVEICLIGSAACILGGMDGRTSRDLDVWSPNSNYDEMELRRAVDRAGLMFDPKSELEPDTAYIQIVEPGIVQLGDFQSVLAKRMGRLRLTRPPYENLVASKLVRAELKDIQDIQFMLQSYRISKESISAAVRSLPRPARDTAMENMIYLEVFK
jgi:hypothetical protein